MEFRIKFMAYLNFKDLLFIESVRRGGTILVGDETVYKPF